VRVTEGPPWYSATFGAYPDPIDSIYASGGTPADGAGAQDIVLMAGQFQTDGTPVVGYRFEFQVSRTDFSPAKILAMDIGYIDLEDPGEGDA
jgi:hypothetical protein